MSTDSCQAQPSQGKASQALCSLWLSPVCRADVARFFSPLILCFDLYHKYLPRKKKNKRTKRNNAFFFLPTFASRLLTLGDSFNQLWNCFTNQKTWEIFSIAVSIFFQKQWFHRASRLDFALGAPLAQLFGGSCAQNTHHPPQHFIDRCRLCLCL